MSGKQTAVIWMGLILIALNFFTGQGWKDLKQALFPASKKTTGSSGTGSGKGSNPLLPSVPGLPSLPSVPSVPLIPGLPISTPGNVSV